MRYMIQAHYINGQPQLWILDAESGRLFGMGSNESRGNAGFWRNRTGSFFKGGANLAQNWPHLDL